MPVARFDLIYLVLLLIVSRSSCEYHETVNTVKSPHQGYSTRENDQQSRFRIPNESSEKRTIVHDQKRQSIHPGKLTESLGIGILPPTGIKSPLGVGINLGLNQGIVPGFKQQINSVNPLATITAMYPVHLYAINSKIDSEKLEESKPKKKLLTLDSNLLHNRNLIYNSANSNNKSCSDIVSNVTQSHLNITKPVTGANNTKDSIDMNSEQNFKNNYFTIENTTNIDFLMQTEKENRIENKLERDNEIGAVNDAKPKNFSTNNSQVVQSAESAGEGFHNINNNASGSLSSYANATNYTNVSNVVDDTNDDPKKRDKTQPIKEDNEIESNDSLNDNPQIEPSFKYRIDIKNKNPIQQRNSSRKHHEAEYGKNNSKHLVSENSNDIKEDVKASKDKNINLSPYQTFDNIQRNDWVDQRLNNYNFNNEYILKYPYNYRITNIIPSNRYKSISEEQNQNYNDYNLIEAYKNRNIDPSQIIQNFKAYNTFDVRNLNENFNYRQSARAIKYPHIQSNPLINYNAIYWNHNTPVKWHYLYHPYMYKIVNN